MRFGEAVQVEYIDLSEPEHQEEFSELLEVVADRDLPYPLLAINGHLRAAGSVHYYRVLPYVEEAFASEAVAQEA